MRYATPVKREWEGWGESTAAIVGMGLVLAVAGIVRTLDTPAPQPVVAFELFVSLLVPTGLATGGYWLAGRNVSSDVRWRAATRVSIGIVVACSLALWLTGYVTVEGGTVRDPLALTTTLAGVGGATGFASAVRELPDVASAGPIGSSGPSPAADSELPATGEPSGSTARPTADAATDLDVPGTDGTAITAETGTSTVVWTNTDSTGRTAAPARPLQSPERHALRGPVPDASARDAVDGAAGSRDPLGSPTPARDPGVDTVAAVPSTAEAVLDVLRNERARLALAVLYHEWDGETRSVDSLARAVSYHTDDSADAVGVALRHATLPELAAIRAVDWDRYADRVAASDHAVFEEGVREAAVLLEAFEPGTR